MKYYGSINESTFKEIAPEYLAYYLQDLDGIEIALHDNSYVSYLHKLGDSYGGEYAFHATCQDAKELREYWAPIYKSFSQFTGLVTLHPLDTLEATKLLLEELQSIEGITFCIENLNKLNNKYRLNEEILRDLDYPDKTFDISHLLFDVPEMELDIVKKYIDERVKNIHIHGFNSKIDHLPLDEKYNYQNILLDYNNVLIFEMHIGYYTGKVEIRLAQYIKQIREFILDREVTNLIYENAI